MKGGEIFGRALLGGVGVALVFTGMFVLATKGGVVMFGGLVPIGLGGRLVQMAAFYDTVDAKAWGADGRARFGPKRGRADSEEAVTALRAEASDQATEDGGIREAQLNPAPGASGVADGERVSPERPVTVEFAAPIRPEILFPAGSDDTPTQALSEGQPKTPDAVWCAEPRPTPRVLRTPPVAPVIPMRTEWFGNDRRAGESDSRPQAR